MGSGDPAPSQEAEVWLRFQFHPEVTEEPQFPTCTMRRVGFGSPAPSTEICVPSLPRWVF